VLVAAIEGNGVLGPAEVALGQRIFTVLIEIIQHASLSARGNTDDVASEAAVDVQGALAR
jgi:hypothetical protein